MPITTRMSCSIISTVSFSSSRRRPTNPVKSADSPGFMPAVGSSSSSSVGSVASARATSSRRWSPYGRFPAISFSWRFGGRKAPTPPPPFPPPPLFPLSRGVEGEKHVLARGQVVDGGGRLDRGAGPAAGGGVGGVAVAVLAGEVDVAGVGVVVEGEQVQYRTVAGPVRAVNDVDFAVPRGK